MPTSKDPIGNRLDFESGGREAIERLIEAYGFTTRQALADHLKLSKSTLANRYLRDTFPSDWIIQCAIETGASLEWLATGVGPEFQVPKSDLLHISNKKIIDGTLYDSGFCMIDKTLVPEGMLLPIAITTAAQTFLADSEFTEIIDGKWLIKVEGIVSIRDVTRVPVGKVKVTDTGTRF